MSVPSSKITYTKESPKNDWPRTNFTFEDTLTQIGLGYVPLFLLGLAPRSARWAALVAILFGYWAAFLWVVVPYVTIPMFDQRYHEKYVDITLPQSLGLTVLGDFPSMVFLLVTAYLIVRALDTHDWTDAVLAGLTGEIIASLITTAASEIEIASLAPERFTS